jgi:hypothetical protein
LQQSATLETYETLVDDRGEELEVRFPILRFADRASVSHPIDDIEQGIRELKTAAAKERYLERICRKGLLDFTIFLEQKSMLYQIIGFDVPSYQNGGADPHDHRSTEWGKILRQLGIVYEGGSDGAISFLFDSDNEGAVAMIKVLATCPSADLTLALKD